MADERFLFRWAPAYRRAAAICGVTPSRVAAVISEDALDVRFGPWRLHTELTNITAAEVTGPYRFVKTAGSARLGITDRGLTFATNGDRGVCISFAAPVPGIEPLGWLRHPELTVTVADIDRFTRVLEQRI